MIMDWVPLVCKKGCCVLYAHYICWPEPNRLPDIFPAKIAYIGSVENCNLGSVTMESHVVVSSQQEKEDASIGRKRKWGGLE